MGEPVILTMGIDPGKTGAVVVLSDGRVPILRCLTPMVEVVRKGKKSSATEYDDRAMLDLLREAPRVDLAVLESQQAMPKQGGVSNFSTGLGFGLWRMALIAAGIPYRIVRPVTWAKVLLAGLTGEGKERNLLASRRELPDVKLIADIEAGAKTDRGRTPHEGIVDAALLARFGWWLVMRGDTGR